MSDGSDPNASRSTAMRPSVPTKQAPPISPTPRVPPWAPDKTTPADLPHLFPGVSVAIDDHSAGILVTGAVVFHEKFHRPRVVGPRCPLNDVVVVLAPIQLADVIAMGASIAIVWDPGGGPQVEVPIQVRGDWLAGDKALRSEERRVGKESR